MDSHTLRVLEFDKVLNFIAQEAVTLYGSEFIRHHKPFQSLAELSPFQARVTEIKALMEKRVRPPLAPLYDIRENLSLTEKELALTPEDLWHVGIFLRTIRMVKDFLKANETPLAHFQDLRERLYPNESLETKIFQTVNENFEILDSASMKLAGIRRRLQTLHQTLKEKLQKLIQTPAITALLQEPLVMERSGRYVVPVKDIYARRFKGILHDRSASGATVFMEPLATVDLNNQWLNTQLESKEEEEAIVRALSAEVGAHAQACAVSLAALAEIDGVCAAARWSLAVKGVPPQMKDYPVLQLTGARHPLLGDSGIPVDIEIGTHFRTLVITGPNTGGKTVGLKTVGLFWLLAQCGFHVPAEKASVGIIHALFADIGDEQSIEQSLSTFSGHLLRILGFLDKADPRSLVLLDELGAGTDPREGAALAMALLQYFHERGGLTVATTHYPEVKGFAEKTAGMSNASMQFDEETLRPLYQLEIGRPGRSLAFIIAAKLGLPEALVESARQLFDHASRYAEELAENLKKQETELAQERETLKAERLLWEGEKKLDAERRQKMPAEVSEKLMDLKQTLASRKKNIKEASRQALVPIESPTVHAQPKWSESFSFVQPAPPPEIHLLGMRVDEALDEVEKYLDRVLLSSLTTVRVVHGKGTGALRKAIHEFLKAHPLVESFRLGAMQEGGDGVTIVKIKPS